MNNPLLYIFLFLFHTVNSALSDTSRLKLIFAGDIMGHDAQIESALQPVNGTYNYDTCFRFVRDYIHSADIALANLEVTLAGEPYKGYPLFSSPDELADAIKKAGFNILVTANNHSMDRSQPGLERTISVLDEKGIIRTGTFYNENQRQRDYPLILEKNKIRIAILNYTYGTNGIPVRFPNIVNLIDTVQMAADLQKAKTADPDFIIVTIHWGTEYEREENLEQRTLAEFMLANGAGAVIGSHPHVVQPIREIYTDPDYPAEMKLVAYSLGNLISNQRRKHTDGGIFLEITLEKTGDKVGILNYSCLPVWVYRPEYMGRYEYILLPGDQPDFYKDIHKMNDNAREEFDFFIRETNNLLFKK